MDEKRGAIERTRPYNRGEGGRERPRFSEKKFFCKKKKARKTVYVPVYICRQKKEKNKIDAQGGSEGGGRVAVAVGAYIFRGGRIAGGGGDEEYLRIVCMRSPIGVRGGVQYKGVNKS